MRDSYHLIKSFLKRPVSSICQNSPMRGTLPVLVMSNRKNNYCDKFPSEAKALILTPIENIANMVSLRAYFGHQTFGRQQMKRAIGEHVGRRQKVIMSIHNFFPLLPKIAHPLIIRFWRLCSMLLLHKSGLRYAIYVVMSLHV